jgi:transcriptional regulator GlxA family with amidase domain
MLQSAGYAPCRPVQAPRFVADAICAPDPDGDPAALWPRMSAPVRAALDHLLANYRTQVSLNDLGALTRRTPFQLIRAFRKELGVTPHAMLIRIRILRAKVLLARGEPIAGVAVDLGFVDQTHFGRHFKRIHKETPGRFLSAMRARRSLSVEPPAFAEPALRVA